MNWTIRNRINAALLLILTLFICTVMAIMLVYGTMRQEYDSLFRHVTSDITLIKDLSTAFHEQNLNIQSFVLTGRQQHLQALHVWRARMLTTLKELTENIHDETLLQQLGTVRLMLAQYDRTVDFIVLVRNEKGMAAAERYLEYGAFLTKAEHELHELVRLSRDRADRFMATSATTLRRLHVAFGIIFLFSITVAVIIAVRVRALIMNPLQQLVAGARSIAKGTFDVTVDIARSDEFSEVGNAFNSMASSLKHAFAELAQGEHKYRELADLLPMIVYEVDSRGYYTYVNQAGYALTGYTREDVEAGLHCSQLIAKEYHGQLADGLARLLSGETLINREYLLQGKDGSIFPCLFFSSPIIEHGAVVGARGSILNISDLKQAEDALKESERKFRGIFEQSYQLMGLLAPDGTLLAANRTSLDFIGVPEKEVVGRPYWQTPWWAHSAAEQQRLRAAVKDAAGGEFVRFETTLFAGDGRLAYIDFSLKPLKNEHGDVVLIIPEGRDITDLKQAAEALQKSEDKYRSIFEQSNDGIFLFDADGKITEWNQKIAEITQLPQQEAIGKFIWDIEYSFFSPAAKTQQAYEHLKSGIQQSLATGESIWKNRLIEIEIHLPDGTRKYIQDTIFPIKTRKGFIWGGIARDITGQKRSEEERLRLSTAIEQADEIIVITDSQGTIQYVNPAFTRVTGYSRDEVVGQTPRILKSGRQDGAFYAHLWSTITSGETWRGRLINSKKDGSPYDEEAAISPVRNAAGDITNFVAVKRDITRELRIESQLNQAQKMEAIGTLAGGIAHDFNNILGVIMGYTELSLDEVPGSPKALSNLHEVLRATDRARELIKQILTISRQQDTETKPVAVMPIVKETLKFMRASLPAMIEIVQRLEADHDVIVADPTQIHQVLMNLCTNAGHSMKEKGGVLEITVKNILIDENQMLENPHLHPGEYLMLSVSDNGCGISQEHLARIFEPYFTTKKIGEGTGLGLAVAHGIARGCGGDITVYSEQGKGTVFHVYLPVAKKEMPASPKTVAELPTGTEHILFVDDEEPLVKIGTEMLERLGYAVTGMTSSDQALAAFQQASGDFDLVITDKAMPRCTGFDLAHEIKKIRPGIPVLLCTGFYEKTDTSRIASSGIDDLLTKPLNKQELARVVRRLIDSRH